MDRSFKLCILLTLGILIPFMFVMVPLYIRHHLYATYHLPLSSTDSRLLNHRVSTFWCESETILMNSTFNSYLMTTKPNFENSTRTFWTTKQFELQSEEREYWGFYLPKNTVITLSICSRYPGAKLTVYKGKRNMKKCTDKEDDDKSDEDDNPTDNDEFLMDSDEEEGSSISSSEEDFLKECSGALFNQTLVATKNCDNVSNWETKDVITYKVSNSDYYYFLFSTFGNLRMNSIITMFNLTKYMYDVSHAQDLCKNVTECHLPFTFGSQEFVVLEMPVNQDWIVDAGEVICQPRTIVYFPFYVGVPLSILFFGFRGIR